MTGIRPWITKSRMKSGSLEMTDVSLPAALLSNNPQREAAGRAGGDGHVQTTASNSRTETANEAKGATPVTVMNPLANVTPEQAVAARAHKGNEHEQNRRLPLRSVLEYSADVAIPGRSWPPPARRHHVVDAGEEHPQATAAQGQANERSRVPVRRTQEEAMRRVGSVWEKLRAANLASKRAGATEYTGNCFCDWFYSAQGGKSGILAVLLMGGMWLYSLVLLGSFQIAKLRERERTKGHTELYFGATVAGEIIVGFTLILLLAFITFHIYRTTCGWRSAHKSVRALAQSRRNSKWRAVRLFQLYIELRGPNSVWWYV